MSFFQAVCRLGLLLSVLFAAQCFAQATSAASFQTMRADAERGVTRAQVMLGKAYLSGTDVDQDDSKGVYWLRQAARDGDSVGQAWLGWAYEHGRGVRKDAQRAYSWYQRSARQGYEWASKQVARLKGMGLALAGERQQEQAVISTTPAQDPGRLQPSTQQPSAVAPNGSAVSQPNRLTVAGKALDAAQLDVNPQDIAARLRDWVADELQKQMPEKMYLEREVPVGLVLSPPPELEQWQQRGIGVRVQADLQVDGAEVKALSKPEQALRPNYPLKWSWEVHALQVGTPLLDLSVRARVVAPDKAPLRVELLRLGPRVAVEMSWQQRMWKLMLENRAAIGFTLLVPLFLWLGMSFAGRKKAD